MSDDGEFVCPNGHPFPRVVAVPCLRCEARVSCVPLAAMLRHDDTADVERYRAALLRIACEQSGVWGTIAAVALSDD